MQVSPVGIALIKRFEGFSPCVYRCPAGMPTIGYGHVVQHNSRLADEITPAQADNVLYADAAMAGAAVARLIRARLTQNQFKYCFGLESRLRGNDKYRVHRLGELPIGSVGTPQIS